MIGRIATKLGVESNAVINVAGKIVNNYPISKDDIPKSIESVKQMKKDLLNYEVLEGVIEVGVGFEKRFGDLSWWSQKITVDGKRIVALTTPEATELASRL